MIDKTQAIKNGITIIDSTKATNALFDILQAQFPQTIKDGQVSLNAIKMLLGLNESASNASGYELTFTGKGLANALYSIPCQKLLKLQESFTPQTLPTSPNKHPKNAIIVGDNLDALKLLKAAYSEKIKMIYIDPPYNTTNENFIYPDNFRQDYKKILEEVGLIEIDENGQEVESEDLKFFKNIQGSRTHSGWLSFMLPRLKLARDLLKEDGVIFISIDDNEQANLKLLCDEIFGEDNFVACLIWNSINSVLKQSKFIRKEHEYILIYAKDRDNLEFTKLKNTMEFSNPDNDPKGEWFSSNAASPNQNTDKNKFPIKLPNGNECVRSWKFSLDDFQNGKVSLYFKNGNVPRLKIYKSEYDENTQIHSSIFKDLGSLTTAKTEIKYLFLECKDDVFDTPKPINLIKTLLQISTTPNSNDIILDFFAGSGTTAQAVMELNAQDNGNREFILVQLDEVIDKSKSKTAYEFCKNELKSSNPVISDITAERVRRVSAKIATKLTKENIDLGFKLYRLESKPKLMSNEKGALRLMTNADLSALDKALNLALQSGKT